jgi:multimeric flavodoxin WrbA
LNFLVLPRLAFISGRILALASVSEKRLALIFQNYFLVTIFIRNFAISFSNKTNTIMKVLILQASPRANGNTAWMAEEYKKAAEAAGHEVTLVNVSKKKIAGCLACEYCHNKGNGACIQKDDMQELYPLMNEAEALVLAAPIYYFTLCAQIQAPIQRMYCVNAPAKVKKMALLMSSYSPGVYDGATAEFRDICNYWKVENMGAVTAKIDEQKTEETKQKIQEIAGRL